MEQQRKQVIASCSEMGIATEGTADCIAAFGLSRVDSPALASWFDPKGPEPRVILSHWLL